MKTLLLISLLIVTHCGQSQTNTSRTTTIDTSYEKKLLKIIFEHRQFSKVVKYQDSIIKVSEQELTRCGLEEESYKVSIDILEIDNKNKMKLLTNEIKDNEQLKSDKMDLEKKLRFQKKLKWVTGITGLIAGVLITTIF